MYLENLFNYSHDRGYGSEPDNRRVLFKTTVPKLDAWESLDTYAAKFHQVSWHDISSPEGTVIDVYGYSVQVSTFGLQQLDAAGSRVDGHIEPEFELIYPLSGTGKMVIMDPIACYDHTPPDHQLRGLYETSALIEGKEVYLFNNGDIEINGQTISPVITPAGYYHGTDGGPLTCLVIKGAKITPAL